MRAWDVRARKPPRRARSSSCSRRSTLTAWLGENEADERAVVVDDGDAPAAVPCQPGCGELLVDTGTHMHRRLGELPDRSARGRGEQPLDRDEADKSLAVADRKVDGAGKRAADEALSDLTGRRLRAGARNARFGSHRCHRRHLLRTALTSSTAAAGSSDSASTIPSSVAPSETVAKTSCSGST